jgi:hypothetical protein
MRGTNNNTNAKEETMTNKQIEARKAQAQVKFDIALKIRAILDEARKAYGATAWDDEDMENEVLELVQVDE